MCEHPRKEERRKKEECALISHTTITLHFIALEQKARGLSAKSNNEERLLEVLERGGEKRKEKKGRTYLLVDGSANGFVRPRMKLLIAQSGLAIV